MTDFPSNRVSPQSTPLKPPRSLALTSIAVAFGAFAPFAAYAYLSEATYRTTAAIVVSGPAGEDLGIDPLEALQQVRAALRAYAKDAVIQSSDGRHFDLVCSASSADGVVTQCDELAQHAMERLPHVLEMPAPKRAPSPEELERRRKAEELVALLAVHPELADSQKAREAQDPKIGDLRSERAALQAALTPRPPEVSPRQPGTPDTVPPDPAVLRARLSAVEKELQERLAALAPKKPSEEVRARWQELVKSAAKPSPDATPVAMAPIVPKAKIAQRATRPSSPITPNRPLVLLLGSLFGLGGGLVAFFARSSRRAQREEPSLAPPEGVSAPPAFSSGPPPGPSEDPGSPPPPREGYELKPPPLPISSPPSPEALLAPSPRAPATSGTVTERPQPALESPIREESAPVRQNRIIELNASAPVGRARLEAEPLRTSAHPAIPPPPSVHPVEPPTTHHFGSVTPQAPPTYEPGVRPPTRITQTFGSPAPPAPQEDAAPSFHPPGYRPVQPARRHSTYSYVSTPPHGVPRVSAHPPPISTPPPPLPISSAPVRDALSPRAPAVEGRPSFSAPVSARPSRAIVTPHPAPQGWKPAPSLAADARRALSNEIFPHAVTQCFVIGVSGVRRAGDDTGRVAAELALALSETGHPRVLLLEGNLQRPTVQHWMRVDMPLFSGLSEQLDGRLQPNRERGGWSVVACSPTLHVLAEGVMSMPELILSRQFEDAVRELRNYYDVIVISGPLISQGAACRAVQDVVDGMILACPEAASPEIEEAAQLFSKKRFSLVLTA